jgi:hypothetical protein
MAEKDGRSPDVPPVAQANGVAERRASEFMLKAKGKAAGRRITAGQDKANDTDDHVANQNNAVTKTGKTRNSAIDERTARRPGDGMRNRAERCSSASPVGASSTEAGVKRALRCTIYRCIL